MLEAARLVTMWRQGFSALLRRKLVRDSLVLQISRFFGLGIGALSLVFVARALGPEEFGRWGLLLALNETWALLNLSGIQASTQTRLAIALGGPAKRDEIAALLAQYLFFSLLWALLSFLVLSALAPIVTATLYNDASLGVWSGWLSLRVFGMAVFQLLVICLRCHRHMRRVAGLHTLNQTLLLALIFLALSGDVAISSLVYARLAHAMLLLLLSIYLLARLRASSMPLLPRFAELLSVLRRVSLWQDWRFGAMIALDKNLGTLFIKIALQWVGAIGGAAMVSPLKLALDVSERITFMMTGLFENMSAIIPRLVGAGEYRQLQRTIGRVQLALFSGSLALSVLLYWLLPGLVGWLFGAEYIEAVPLMRWLLLYVNIVLLTGIFGPLYRALRQVRLAAFAKMVALATASILAHYLMVQHGALGGVFYILLLYAISGLLTARFTLKELNRRVAS